MPEYRYGGSSLSYSQALRALLSQNTFLTRLPADLKDARLDTLGGVKA